MLQWELFKSFFIIGLVSFGGGYAMIPVIETKVQKYAWMTTQQFSDIITIAGMAPGPIATNSAILIGYSTAGVTGALIAAFGILLPSFIIVLLLAKFFRTFNHNPYVKSMFYGLKPIVTSLIVYAAFKLALSHHQINMYLSWHSFSLILIFAFSLFALLKLKWHPIYVLTLSGLVGAVLYT